MIMEEYQRRLKKNPHLRLMDFAQELNVPPSRISELLSGRVGISVKRAEKFASLLNFSPEMRSLFLELVNRECGRSKWVRKSRASSKDSSYEVLAKFSLRIPNTERERFLRDIHEIYTKWHQNFELVESAQSQIRLEVQEMIKG